MNPVVLIATYNRLAITRRNIELLYAQSVKPQIILMVSSTQEFSYFKTAFKDAHVIVRPNSPLGAKWQYGAAQSARLNPDFLIVTGSDDILGEGFIENASRLISQGNHFIGLRRWWQHKEGRAYCCEYKAKDNLPIGGARCYSVELLRKLNYKIFDHTRDRHLDEFGWDAARKSGLKCLVLDNPENEGLSIHAIKGDWDCFNPFRLNHPNIRLIRSERTTKVLPNFYEN